jgi:signal transduction histidine kinase/CheY-like chemotaxis protein
LKKRSRQFWEQTVADFHNSPLTQKAFCKQHNIKLSTLQYWIYRLRREALQGTPAYRAHQSSLLQRQLHQSQKMKAINNLASTLANDFNNILTAIMGLTSAIMADAKPSESALSDFRGILAACRKGHDLTRNLLAFSGEVNLRQETVSLNQLIEEVTSLLAKILPQRVAVETRLDPDLPPIEGDAGLLTHVLLSLATNASAAIPSEGALTSEDEPGRGPQVKLVVADTGEGMDAHTLEHAMEPFFSTRPREQGIGLGLSMVYSTVTKHGGRVSLDSTPGQGTIVTLHLPVLEGYEQQPVLLVPTPELARPGTGMVLLVDDEELVLSAARRLLEMLGYQVLGHATAADALAAYRENHAEITLALIDLKMPQMSGVELYRALKQIDPEVRVIFSSGHIMGSMMHELQALGQVNFLQKPYDFENLKEAMRKASLR